MKIDRDYLKYYFDFLWAMTEKEIKARYKKAYFGFLWVILNPLFQMLIIGFVFSFFIKIPNYFLFLFTGLLPWGFFSMSLAKATPSFVNERSLLQKAKFPKEAIPVSIILSNFFHLLVALGLLLIYLFVTGGLVFPRILLVIPVLAALLIFTIGMSLLTASLQVKYRDIAFFVQSLLILWFYATPVLYEIELIPKSVWWLFSLNPLAGMFEVIRWSVLGQGVIESNLLIYNFVMSGLLVISGAWVYRKENKYFVDWL